MPKRKVCRGRKSCSEGFIKLFCFDTFPACVFIVILFFPPAFLGFLEMCSSFGGVPAWYGGAKNKMGKEVDEETQMWEKIVAANRLCSLLWHMTHEKDGDPTQGCWLVATMLTCGVCNRARDTLHILLILSVHLYQSLCISPPPFICHSFQSPLLSLHPRVSPPSATFIYSSQLSVHSIPPQSSTTLPPLIHKHISQSMFTKAETH